MESLRFNRKTIFLFLVFLFLCNPSYSNILNFHPEVSVLEDYTDNYFQDDNKKEEFYTTYLLGIHLESLSRKSSTKLSYTPSYTDYSKYDENDSFEHDLIIAGDYNLTRKTDLSFNQDFSKKIDRTIRTGAWEEHDKIDSLIGLENRFGKDDKIGINLKYNSDSYENPNVDDYEKMGASINLSYWFNVKYGFDSGLSYEKTKFNLTSNDKETYKGNIKLHKKFTKHLKAYLGYSHSYSEDDTRKHTILNPMTGLNWRVSKNADFTLGAGMLFHQYSDEKDSSELFVNADIYKNFDLNKRLFLAVSAQSGYEETSEDAVSLGFNIFYKAGFASSYKTTKRSQIELSSSYESRKFEEETDRQDNTFDLSTSINFSIFRWMHLRIYYSHRNFNTDSDLRVDYKENKAGISINLSPKNPSRIKSEPTKEKIIDQIYN